MSTRLRIIALGQPAAGDDGAGCAVLKELRQRGVPSDVELVHARDATELIWLLETRATVVVVDAALASPAGNVLELDVDELYTHDVQPMSCHGLGVAEVIALARELSPARMARDIRIVAITIAQPSGVHDGLSRVVAAAVTAAVDRILELGAPSHDS